MTVYKTCRAMVCRTLSIVAIVAAFSVTSHAQNDLVTLNFTNADVESLATAIGNITGKNFIIDPRVKGPISVVSSKPVPSSQVYDFFLSALRLQGLTAIESGGFVRIMSEADAKMYGGEVSATASGDALRTKANDQLVTQVFKLRHESAAQLVNVLKPLISPNNSITASPGTNSLVITDYAINLDRLAKIIASIDRPVGDDVEVIPVRHMSALDLSTILNQIYGEGGIGGNAVTGGGSTDSLRRMTIIPETRSNTLIIRGASPSRLVGVMNLIQKIDTPTNATGNIHVVYLRNAEAIKLAAVLRGVLEGDSSSLNSAFDTGSTSSFSQGMLGLTSGSGSVGSTSGTSSMSNVSSTMGSTFNQNNSSSTLSSLLNGGGDSKGGMIQADPMTNSLIINAPEPVYRNLRAVIDLLDARRAQVFIESLIVEVTSETAAEFGIQWQGVSGFDKDGRQVIGGTNFGDLNSGNILGVMSGFNNVKRGLNVGIMDGTVNIPGIGEVTNLSFLAHAMEAQGKTNILSTPNMLTLDNEEATIVVGQNIPIMTGSYANTGSTASVTPFQTYDRQDVGLTLKIKPQISESGTVRLQIYQEISSVANTSYEGGVVTNKRAFESQVLVDDGQIVVLGGLVQDSLTGGEDGVPLLSSIPVLGYLFKNENRTRSKTNLMVFLRPYILRDAKGSAQITSSRYDYIRGVQERETFVEQDKYNFIMPDVGAPQLPENALGSPATLLPGETRQEGARAYPASELPQGQGIPVNYYGTQPVDQGIPDQRTYLPQPVQTETPVTYYQSPVPVTYAPPPVEVTEEMVIQSSAPRVTAPVVVQQTQAPRVPAPEVQYTAAPRTVVVPQPVVTPSPMPTGPIPVRRQTAYDALEAAAVNTPARSSQTNEQQDWE